MIDSHDQLPECDEDDDDDQPCLRRDSTGFSQQRRDKYGWMCLTRQNCAQLGYDVYHCDDAETCASGVCESAVSSSHFQKQKCRYGFKLVNDTDCVPDPNANSVKCNFTGPLEITKEADLAPLIDCTEIKAQGTWILSLIFNLKLFNKILILLIKAAW